MKRFAGVVLVLGACGGEVMQPSTPTVTSVAVQSIEGAQLPLSAISLSRNPSRVGLLAGAPLFAFSDEVQTLSGVLPVGAAMEPSTLGSVQQLVTRENGGAFVVSSTGLFHDQTGRLLRSPLTDELAMTSVSSLDALGSGDAEELWLAMASGAKHWRANRTRAVSISFGTRATTKPEALLAFAPGKAVYVAASQFFLVDVASDTARWIAADVGTVRDWVRFEGGLVIVTSTGLFKVSSTGAVSKLDIAQPRAVTTSNQALWLATQTGVGTLDNATFTVRGHVDAVEAHGLAVDSSGAVWTVSSAGVLRLGAPLDAGSTFDGGMPVFDAGVRDAGVTRDAGVAAAPTWAADVQPLLTAKCGTCHKYGFSYAPGLVSYDYASLNAEYIYTRLSEPSPTARMPPQGSSQLSAAQISLFRNWIDGGLHR